MCEKRSLGEEDVLSLQDIINEDSELETMANAVLGGSNDQSCTFTEGYVPRQAVYSCLTCKTDDAAGICLACSLECHDGHDLCELYTKRNFRCDCGNSKFGSFQCALFNQKDPVNEKNSYNHNFSGTYCTCQRPYPDPEDDVDDEMIQCVVCEDWFHTRHLLGSVPATGFSEMICHVCMKEKAKLLWYYVWSLENKDGIVDIMGVNDTKSQDDIPNVILEKTTNACGYSKDDDSINARSDSDTSNDVTVEKEHSINLSDNSTRHTNAGNDLDTAKEVTVKKEHSLNIADHSTNRNNKLLNKFECLSDLEVKYKSETLPDSSTYWPENWRNLLCPCSNCRMKLAEVNFLYITADSMAEYEKMGATKHKEPSVVTGMRALGDMNRVQQVEVIQGYNDMKANLSEFLRDFAEQGKVVTEQDIRNFFQKMSQAKRPRLNLAHSCK